MSIKTFEQLTTPLNEKEKASIDYIKLLFELDDDSSHTGIYTNRQIANWVDARSDGKIKLSDVRIRKVINHIRVNRIITKLIADSRGYHIAKNDEEVSNYLQSLNDRIDAIIAVRDSFLLK